MSRQQESPHPSALALDRLALGGEAPEGMRAHLAACEACRAHVARVRTPAEPVPAWARQLAAAPREEARGLSRWRAWLRPSPVWGAGLAAAAAAVLLVFTVPAFAPGGEGEGGSGVRAKGTPGVLVYLRQGGRVVQWDARSPVAAGDEVRLKLVGDGFTHVAVASLPAGEGAAPEVLHQGVLAAPEELLPQGWQFDASPGAERVGVVFSLRPLTGDELASALRARARTADVWTSLLVFEKREGGQR